MKKIKKRSKDVKDFNYDDMEWTEKEINELYNLMRKFPVGSRNRWELVANGFKNK